MWTLRKKDLHNPAFSAQPELQVCLECREDATPFPATPREAQSVEVSLLWAWGDKPKVLTAQLPGRDGVCTTGAVLQPAQDKKE